MRSVVAVVAVVVGGALLVPWQHGAPAPLLDEPRLAPVAVAAPASLDALRAAIGEVLAREGVPGAGIALVDRDGPIWVGGVGVADATTRAPVTADTVFRAASLTKGVVGLGVMRLVEQGRLDLDAPLRGLVPDAGIANPWEDVAPVTLAQVLEHTAGLDDMRFDEVFSRDDALAPSAALAINPRSRVVRWPPGTRMAYSNVGYTLAGRAIEIATGEPFDAWLRREILAPLGMADADFRRTPALAARLATGYVDRGRPAPFSPIAHRAAGALLASPADLARLVQFLLRRDGGPVSPAGLDRIERGGTLPYARLDTDYGLGNGGDVGQPVRARGHDGGLPGFVSSLRYFPELGRGYVVMLDASHSLRALLEIRALVFAYLAGPRRLEAPEDRRAPVGEPVPLPPGAFAFASPRHALLGFVDRALLAWRVDGAELVPLFGAPIAVVPAGGAYRQPHESGSSLQFARGADGAAIMVGGFGYAEATAWWPVRLRAALLALGAFALAQAPLWLLGVVALAAIRRRRLVAFDLLLWPAIAGLCMRAVPRLFFEASLRQVLGEVHPLTIAICATTIAFAVAAGAGAVAALRWQRRPDRPPWWSRLVPTLCAAAALGYALWFAANGIIGLRTWAW